MDNTTGKEKAVLIKIHYTIDQDIFIVKYFHGLHKPQKLKKHEIYFTTDNQDISVCTVSQHS